MKTAEVAALPVGTKLYRVEFEVGKGVSNLPHVHAAVTEVEVRACRYTAGIAVFRGYESETTGETNWKSVNPVNCYPTRRQAETELYRRLTAARDEIAKKLAAYVVRPDPPAAA